MPGCVRGVLLTAFLLVLPAMAVPPKAPAVINARPLPLYFEPCVTANCGQVTSLKFMARSGAASFFIAPDRWQMALPGPKKGHFQPFSMRFLRANRHARVSGAEPLPGRVNYLFGRSAKDWSTQLPTYGAVAVRSLYPGIDVTYHGSRQQIEFDLDLAPGADSGRVVMQFNPSRTLRLDAAGNLHLGALTLRRPKLYQRRGGGRVPVEGRFVLLGHGKVGLCVGSYDHARALVVDPTLVYATYFPGAAFNLSFHAVSDAAGDLFLADATSGAVPTTSGAYATQCGPDYCGFIAEINPTGSALVYSTYIPGQVDAMALDADGNVVFVGATDTSANEMPVTAGELTFAQSGGSLFAAELAVGGGTLVYATALGAPASTFGVPYSMAIGPQDQVVLDSGGNSRPGVAVVNGFQSACSATLPPPNAGTCEDDFFIEFQPHSYQVAYSTYFEGAYPNALASDASGAIYLGGVAGNLFVTPTAFQRSACSGISGDDGFVAKIDPSKTGAASLVYSTFLCGDNVTAIAADGQGNAYVTGYLTGESRGFPFTPGSYRPACLAPGASGAVESWGYCDNAPAITKLNPSGTNVIYSTLIGSLFDSGDPSAIAVDASGAAVIAGQALSADYPTTTGAVQPFLFGANGGPCVTAGCRGTYVTKLNPAGTGLVYSTNLSGTVETNQDSGPLQQGDSFQAVGTDTAGDILVAGTTDRPDYPVTPNALYGSNPGDAKDAFAAAISGVPDDLTLFVEPGNLMFYSDNYGPAGGTTINLDQYGCLNPAVCGYPTGPLSRQIQLFNNSASTLTISSIKATGDFTESDACNGTIAAGASCDLTVVFDPTAPGNRTGTLTITDSDASSPQVAQLFGVGLVPVPNLSANELTFAATDTGSPSASQTVTITNSGNVTWTPSAIKVTGDFSETDNCSNGVQPNLLNCGIAVTFTPTMGGPRTGTLTIADNAPGSPRTVQLSGTGNGPAAVFSPATLNFASQMVGSASSAQPVMLSNPGTAALTITSLAASGPFSETNNCGSSLPAGGTCTINVKFAPTTAGPLTGALSVSDSLAGSPQTASLSGTATAPAAAVTLAPASLSFSAQQVSTTSAAQPVTLTNSGQVALTISSIAASGDFAETNNCPASLAPAANCTINVNFTPQAAGARSGALTVTDNAPDSPESVALVGTATAPAPAAALSPLTLTFASQLTGSTSAPRNVILANSGQASLTITSIAASGDFAETNNCGASLAQGASCTIAVTFTPTAAGARTGTLTVADDAAGSPQTAALSGTGTAPAPAATLAPASLGFGGETVGVASTAQTITLSNGGTGALAITAIAASGDFSETNNCPASLAAQADCAISVTFKPTAVGARNGSLSVTDNAAGSPQTAALSGSGAATATPAVSLSPPSLAFASQFTGTASAAQTITLTNTGQATLAISAIAASGDFTQTNTCGASLAAGKNCAIAVTFKPTATGARTGTLAVTDNAADSPETAALTGTGADLTITPGSGSSTTSTVAAGQTASYALSFAPVSGATGTFSLACTGAPAGATCTPTPATISLSGTQPVAATVAVTTTARSLAPPLEPRGGPAWPWLAVLLLLPVTWLLRQRRRWLLPATCAGLLALTLACGGGSGSSTSPPPPSPPSAPAGTPAGTYTLTLTATGPGGVTRSATLTLTVN